VLFHLHYFFTKYKQEILLDCDQSNVLLVYIIVFCILLKAFPYFQLVLETRHLIETRVILY